MGSLVSDCSVEIPSGRGTLVRHATEPGPGCQGGNFETSRTSGSADPWPVASDDLKSFSCRAPACLEVRLAMVPRFRISLVPGEGHQGISSEPVPGNCQLYQAIQVAWAALSASRGAGGDSPGRTPRWANRNWFLFFPYGAGHRRARTGDQEEKNALSRRADSGFGWSNRTRWSNVGGAPGAAVGG